MIVKDQINSVETIGNITNQSEFKIKVSPKAFQILSSLYSDKPLAIVRELGCNAMDSHIVSGQPNRPIHVHVPNSLEPWLTIQDFGTGISHENIYKIYTEYFNSTKTNTNDQVGMLGLGSKSPFCYTDSFTITSIHEGVKRIYNAYFNQQGVPTISLASQENTKDHNGVAVQIPIKQSDIGSFFGAVQKAFQFFDVKPIIVGGDVKWDRKVDFEGTFWKSMTSLNQSYAIMGGVSYPIDTYKLSDDNYEITRKAGLVINFDIGELDVTPSRESLMYHDWVLENINNKIQLVKKDFISIVEKTITTSENLLDAMKALYMLKDNWSFLNSSMIKGKVMWKNMEITDPRKSITNLAPELVSYSKARWGRSKISQAAYPALHNHAVWYYSNLPKGSIRRAMEFVKTHGDSDIAVNLVSESEMKALIKAGFPASIFTPTNTLPSPNVSRRTHTGTKTSKPKGTIVLYDLGIYYRESWDSKDFNLETDTAPKYFIPKTDGFKFNLGTMKGGNDVCGIKTDISDKRELEAFMSYLGIDMKDVRMVARTNAKYLEELGSINLIDHVKSKLQIKLDFDKIEMGKLIDLDKIKKITTHKLFSKLDDENPLKIFIDENKENIEEIKKLKGLHSFVFSRNNNKKDLTFENPMVELLYLTCDTWQVGIDKVMKAAVKMNKPSK